MINYFIKKYLKSIEVSVMVFLILFLSACGESTDSNVELPEDPIIVWIVVDTLRADHLGCYGYPRNTSPFIDQLALNGVIFENAISPSSWTLPSFASMLTGLKPKAHGMLAPDDYYSDSSETLAEILRRNGFKTAAFQRSIFVTDAYGLLRGFDTKIQEIPDDAILSRLVINWLNNPQNISGKTFLFLGYWSPHKPNCPPNELLRPFINDNRIPEIVDVTCEDLLLDQKLWYPASFFTTENYPWLDFFFSECNFYTPRGWGNFDPNLWVAAYDAEILYADTQISRVINRLKELGVWDRTFLIITADHGEMMTEKKESLDGTLLPFSHGRSLDEGVIHVPLVVYSSLFESGRVIEQPVGTIDLVATVLEYAGAEAPEHIQGNSLLPLLLNQVSETQGFAYSHLLLIGANDVVLGEVSSIRGLHFKLVQNDNELHLYNLDLDPEEKNDLSNDPVYTGLLNIMKYRLDKWLEDNE